MVVSILLFPVCLFYLVLSNQNAQVAHSREGILLFVGIQVNRCRTHGCYLHRLIWSVGYADMSR